MKIGRVISRNRNDCLVCEINQPNQPNQLNQPKPIKLSFPKKNTEVYTGDFVSYQLNQLNQLNQFNRLNQKNNQSQAKANGIERGHQGQLLAVLEPKNCFFRIDSYGNQRIIARNINQLALIVAAFPKPSFLSIDATLALCKLNQIEAVIVINKSDLRECESVFKGIERYQDYGAKICFSSIYDSKSIDRLRQIFNQQTTLLFGLSGVGKSSLIKQFFPNQTIETQILVAKTQKGKHTTSQAKLYIGEKIELIDTAGLGNETISYFDSKSLANLFEDFLPYLNDCKYRNCNHSANQSSCGLVKAVNEGKIHPQRLKQYQLIQDKFTYQ